ncbi:hypothetical protein MRX96_030752 [Rhipicephalus microplus]
MQKYPNETRSALIREGPNAAAQEEYRTRRGKWRQLAFFAHGVLRRTLASGGRADLTLRSCYSLRALARLTPKASAIQRPTGGDGALSGSLAGGGDTEGEEKGVPAEGAMNNVTA